MEFNLSAGRCAPSTVRDMRRQCGPAAAPGWVTVLRAIVPRSGLHLAGGTIAAAILRSELRKAFLGGGVLAAGWHGSQLVAGNAPRTKNRQRRTGRDGLETRKHQCLSSAGAPQTLRAILLPFDIFTSSRPNSLGCNDSEEMGSAGVPPAVVGVPPTTFHA